MSRRYGRNQKRRAREEIARLNTEARIAASNATQMRNDLVTLQDTIDYVKKTLGAHSVVLPPSKAKIARPHPGDFLAHDPRSPVMGGTVAQAKLMRMLLVQAESDYDIRAKVRRVHMLVEIGDGSAAYVIEDEALHSIDTDVLANVIARQIAEHLRKEISKHARRIKAV